MFTHEREHETTLPRILALGHLLLRRPRQETGNLKTRDKKKLSPRRGQTKTRRLPHSACTRAGFWKAGDPAGQPTWQHVMDEIPS